MPYIQASTITADMPKDPIARSWARSRSAESTRVQEVEGFSFGDLIDLINPFHHIPVVGPAYRKITGDEIKPSVQVAGDLMYGAATGSVLLSGAMSVATMAYEQEHGLTPLVELAGAFFNDDKVQPTPRAAGSVQLAGHDYVGVRGDDHVNVAAAEQVVISSQDQVQIAAQNEMSLQAAQTVQGSPPARSAHQMGASYGGIKIGNKIYTNLTPRAFAPKVAAQSAPSQTQPTTESAAQQLTTQPTAHPVAQSTPPLPATTPVDQASLGKKMHEQAIAQKAGVGLPPELVRDMMIMALDKYKTAGKTSSLGRVQ